MSNKGKILWKRTITGGGLITYAGLVALVVIRAQLDGDSVPYVVLAIALGIAIVLGGFAKGGLLQRVLERIFSPERQT